MKKLSYAVFGLGKFGMSVAQGLLDAECDVMVIDKSEENIQEVASRASYAIKADVMDAGVLDSIGLGNVDVVVIAIAENLEANILTAMYAREKGVGRIIVKCTSSLHAAILDKIGVDEVIYPEREMGRRVAANLVTGGAMDMIELSPIFSMAEVKVPKSWAGKSLIQLRVRDIHKINVVAVKQKENIEILVDPNKPLEADDVLVVLGLNEDLRRLAEQ